jgi:MerR family transcriptional regulator, thiopeptide resistance regulator
MNIREFAELAGISVRTLQHYDRLGILTAKRTASGYRVYTESDLATVQQIVALKAIGLPLRRVAELLPSRPAVLAEALAQQRAALEEKQRQLVRLIAAVRHAEAELQVPNPDQQLILRRLIEVLTMHNQLDWIRPYFKPESHSHLDARQASLTPDEQAALERQWSELFQETQAKLDLAPSSPEAQSLVAQWESLARALVGGDTELVHGIKSLYADRANWPTEVRERLQTFLDDRVWRFIFAAIAARPSPA